MSQKQDSTGDTVVAGTREFDPDALRAKYDAERDRRLRPDAEARG